MNAHQEGACDDMPRQDLPHSEAARDNVVLLPLANGMAVDDQARVVHALNRTFVTAKAG